MQAQKTEVAGVSPAGASGGARQQNPPNQKEIVCRHVRDLIDDMRSDMYLAVRLNEFVKLVNERIKAYAEERGVEAVEVAEEDVKRCIRYYDEVKIVDDDVLWLWGGWYAYYLVEKVADMARKYGSVLAEPEK